MRTAEETHVVLFSALLSHFVRRCFHPFCVGFLSRSDSQEAAAGTDHLHPLAARCPGGSVRQNPVPGHLHAGGGRAENQPARVQSPGEKCFKNAILISSYTG